VKFSDKKSVARTYCPQMSLNRIKVVLYFGIFFCFYFCEIITIQSLIGS